MRMYFGDKLKKLHLW